MTSTTAAASSRAAKGAALPAISSLLLDGAIAGWLWFALQRFTAHADSPWPRILIPVTLSATLAMALGLSRGPAARGFALALRCAAAATGLAAAYCALSRPLELTHPQGLWLGLATGSLLWVHRALLFLLPESERTARERLRWTALGVAGTLVVLPFYHAGHLGSGDAHWYAIMVGDFVTQLRAGVFPVWVGQSLYAFNGAVSPLRYAPGILYASGLLDLLTAQSLQIVALRNALLAVIALLGVFSAYACLRPILRNAPWTACLLAILWVASPGVLAPPMIGDLFMSFSTLPFAPLVLHGCWRVWRYDDLWSRVWIAVGLAGAWLAHSPVALWFTLISAGIYLPTLARPSLARQLKFTAVIALLFIALGSVPFLSVVTLDNQIKTESLGAAVPAVLRSTFPANFLPIDPRLPGLETYQLGYALLGVLALSLLLLLKSRPVGAWAFCLASVAIGVLVVPVPWVTAFLWSHAPNWFVTIQNVWPMQRLFLVWTLLCAFTGAVMLGSPAVASRRRVSAAVTLGLLLGVGWSALEVGKLHRGIVPRRGTPEAARLMDTPGNLVLTRYAYSSFAQIPGYFSHAHMEAALENRLLDIDTLTVQSANADAAAPAASDALPAGVHPVEAGTWTATRGSRPGFYSLSPRLALRRGVKYALRIDFEIPDTTGTLQLTGSGVVREFTLPDSGAGAGDRTNPRSFGSLPTSSHVIALETASDQDSPQLTYISGRDLGESFSFARFSLFTYEPDKLPVAVQSWIPYRARVTTSRPAYLETPRLWLDGWRAFVNGVPAATVHSPDNLVMVPLGAGVSQVELRYQPPAVLWVSVWVAAIGWLGLATVTLTELVFRAADRSDFLARERWVPRPGSVLDALTRLPVRGFLQARRHWRVTSVALAGILSAAILFLWASHRQRAATAYLEGVGPVQLAFREPERALGTTQPLLASGHAAAGTVISIKYLDNRHVRLNADIWGENFSSEPLEFESAQEHHLVVSDSALFPLEHPRMAALSPSEVSRLRANLSLDLDGRQVLQVPRYAYETTLAELRLGESPFGNMVGQKYAGVIGALRRLPIPRRLVVPPNYHATARVSFPEGRIGRSEPLVSAISGRQRFLCFVTYLDNARARLTVWKEGGAITSSNDFPFTPHDVYTLSVWVDSHGPDATSLELTCTLDGKRVLGSGGTEGVRPIVFSSGTNEIDAPGVQHRFTGPQLDLEIAKDSLAAEAPASEGPVEMVVTLPTDRTSRREPLLTTGHTGAADIIYVIYDSPTTLRIGFDHWGYGGKESAAIVLSDKAPHSVWIDSAALRMPPGQSTGSKAAAKNPSAGISVRFDGKTVLSDPTIAYPATGAEVVPGKNPVGASTCEPEFTGTVDFFERAGTGAH